MRTIIAALVFAALAATAAPATAQDRQFNRDVRQAEREYQRDLRRADNRRDVREARRDYRENLRDARQDRNERIRDWRQARRYDWNRFEPGYRGYYPERYYRDGRYYRPVRLNRQSRIYRGQDNRYYCRRGDGTTGLVAGAAVGGVFGNIIASGNSRLLGTLLGGAGGALLGREIDRGNVVCR